MITVHLVEEKKTIAIPECSSLTDLSLHSSTAINRLAFSHLFFQKIIAYCELTVRGEASIEEVEKHLEEFTEAYNTNSLDFDGHPDDTLNDKILNVISDDDFVKKYDIFLRAISGEIFKLFACGAVAYEEGDMELSTLSPRMTGSIPTKA
jgi:hypothetical protein